MSIPVLMYHHINEHAGDLITITPQVFEGQMRFLSESGFHTLTLDELLSYMRGRHFVPKKGVVITFDDGYLDNYIHAFPVMKQYGLKASIFIVVSWIEGASSEGQSSGGIIEKDIIGHGKARELIRKGRAYKTILNWDMIEEMQDSGLVEFYSHTMTHRRCDELLEDELRIELKDSKDYIEGKLGRPCPYLCWPTGNFNELAVSMAKGTGYKAIFTTRPGVVRKKSDPFFIERIVTKNGIGWFRRRMGIYTNPLLSKLYLRFKGKV